MIFLITFSDILFAAGRSHLQISAVKPSNVCRTAAGQLICRNLTEQQVYKVSDSLFKFITCHTQIKVYHQIPFPKEKMMQISFCTLTGGEEKRRYI